MSEWHGYFLVENKSATLQQMQELVSQLSVKGLAENSSQPCNRMQIRKSKDGNSIIYEAVFDTGMLNPQASAYILAEIIGVPSDAITVDVSQDGNIYTGTYSFSGIVIGQTILFGDPLLSTWDESRNACNAYLIANADTWNNE